MKILAKRTKTFLMAAILVMGGVAASVEAATSSSEASVACPADSKVMTHRADYLLTDPIDGFDSPEAAMEHLLSTAYPGMPRGHLKKVRSSDSKTVLESGEARATVIEVDRLVPNDARTGLVLTENGTAWVVGEFTICAFNAQQWGVR